MTIPHLHEQLVSAAALVGVLLPFLAAVLKQDRWSAKTNNAIALAAAVTAGVLTAVARGELSAGSIVQSIVSVVVLSHTAYEALYKPQGWAETVQRLTSFHKAPDYTPVLDAPTATEAPEQPVSGDVSPVEPESAPLAPEAPESPAVPTPAQEVVPVAVAPDEAPSEPTAPQDAAPGTF
jgi:hypothetical protein